MSDLPETDEVVTRRFHILDTLASRCGQVLSAELVAELAQELDARLAPPPPRLFTADQVRPIVLQARHPIVVEARPQDDQREAFTPTAQVYGFISKTPTKNADDDDLASACREFLKGCSCAPAERPQDCPECTEAFLEAVLERARKHGLPIGENAIRSLNDPA